VKDIILALISGLIPLLPQFLKTPLDFLGVTEYLEKSLDKYNKFEVEKKEQKEYLEYAKKIEKERPQSPSKLTKIDLSMKPKSQTIPASEGGRKVYDATTKQFKIVPTTLKTSSEITKIKQQDDTNVESYSDCEKLMVNETKPGSNTSRNEPSSRNAQKPTAIIRETSKNRSALTTEVSSLKL